MDGSNPSPSWPEGPDFDRVTESPRRPERSRVRHGQPSCADYGCMLPLCQEAARRARRARSEERAQGRASRTDATAAADHTVRLRERGLSAQDIADRAGISVTLIRRLLKPDGQRPRHIARTTSDAILGVGLPSPTHNVALAGRGLIAAQTGTRMLTELSARGWPATRLARFLCVNPHTVSAIRNGQHDRISVAIDQRIRRVYSELLHVDPVTRGVRCEDAARARTWATRRLSTPAGAPTASKVDLDL